MKVFVWDLPQRLFHWLLAAMVVGCFVSAEMGGNAMDWHARFGFAVLALMIFRLSWGFFGGTYARIQNFLTALRALPAWWRNGPVPSAGYTPPGSVALIVMFLLLWGQAFSGLFANDDVMLEGPLYHLVAQRTADWLTAWHKRGFYLLGGMVLLHVSAIFYYRIVKRIDYIRPMITGYKLLPDDTPPALQGRPGSLPLALLLAAASSGAVWYLVTQL